MKYVIVLLLALTNVLETNSQSLAGVWEGWFLSPANKIDTLFMKLDFRLKNDSTYEVYNFTKEGDFKSVCKMSYKLLSKYSIYLEEVEVTRTNMSNRNINLQNMKLNIEKDFKTMAGRWFFNIKELRSKGEIYFRKKE